MIFSIENSAKQEQGAIQDSVIAHSHQSTTCGFAALVLVNVILFAFQGSLGAQVKLEKTGEFRTGVGGGAVLQLNNHLVFDADGGRLLSQGCRGDLVLWDTKTWHELARSEAPSGGQAICALHPSRAIVALKRGRFSAADAASAGQLHDLKTGATTNVCKEPFLNVAFGTRGRSLVARIRTSHGQELLLVSLSREFEVYIERRIKLPENECSVLRLSEDGSFAFLTGLVPHVGHLRIDLKDPKSIPTAHKGGLLALDLTGTATTWTDEGIHRRGANLSQKKRVGTVKTSCRGGRIAFAENSNSGASNLFLIDDELKRITTRTSVETFAVSSRGVVALFADNGPLHIYSDAKHRVLGGHFGPATELVWSADGRYLAARGLGAVTVAHRSGEVIKRMHGNFGVAGGSTGSEFWFADDRSIRRFHASLNRMIQRTALPEGWTVNLYDIYSGHSNRPFAKDLLALAGGDNFVVRRVSDSDRAGLAMFRSRESEVMLLARPEPKFATALARPLRMASHRLSHYFAIAEATPPLQSGTSLVMCKFYGALRVFDTNGNCVHAIATENSLISIGFSPSGQRLVFADSGGQITVLETEGFTEVASLQADGLRWLAFLEENQIISHDGTGLTTWDFASGMLRDICILPEQDCAKDTDLGVAALSQDSAYLALARGDRVRVYQLLR